MFQITSFVFIVTIGSLTFFASVGQLLVRKRKFENYNLWALFLVISILFFQAALAVFSDTALTCPAFLFMHLTALFLLGVILYFAYALVCDRTVNHTAFRPLYLVPSGAAFIFDVLYLSLPEDEKVLILKSIFYGEYHQHGIFIKLLFAAAALQCFILLAGLLKTLLGKIKTDRGSLVLPEITITYIILSTAAVNLIAASYILGNRTIISIVYVATGFLMVGTFLVSHRYPSFLQLVPIDVTGRKYSRSGLDGLDIDGIKTKLDALMKNDKLFKEENLSLTDLADELSITSHQLSRFLNENMNMSFYSYINHHRIKEAIMIFSDNRDMNILSIAYEVGFNSKSSFYNAFFKFTGKTPKQYKKSILKSRPS